MVDPTTLDGGFATLRGIPIDPDERFRVGARMIRPDGLIVLVAVSVEDEREVVLGLAASLAVAVPLVTVLLATLTWWLVGAALSPVEGIRRQAAAMGGGELHLRVPVPDGDDEIARLATTVNDLLARIEQSSDATRQFVADASHELRTPLTRMRVHLETQGRDGTGGDRTRQSSLHADVVSMQALADDLLLLARGDSGSRLEPTGLVDTVDLVADAVAAAAQAPGGPAPTLQLHQDEQPDGDLLVMGDQRQLRRAVDNVLANARRHADSRVAVHLAGTEEAVVITIGDDGAGVPAERRRDVFERFVRLDDARSRDAGGHGLGLAIVRDVMTRHGGWVDIRDSELGGAAFVLRLPRAPDPTTAADPRVRR